MVDAKHAASISKRVEDGWQTEKSKAKLPPAFEERGKRAWLKRAYFQMVEEVVCPNAAPSKAVPPKASPVKRRPSEGAKRQSVNPQAVQIMQAGVWLVESIRKKGGERWLAVLHASCSVIQLAAAQA